MGTVCNVIILVLLAVAIVLGLIPLLVHAIICIAEIYGW